jgi:hypothetical protein
MREANVAIQMQPLDLTRDFSKLTSQISEDKSEDWFRVASHSAVVSREATTAKRR